MATENSKKTVKIRLPLTRTEKNDEYVAINGKSIQIQRGKTVEVAENVADVIRQSEEMLSASFEYEEQAKKNLL